MKAKKAKAKPRKKAAEKSAAADSSVVFEKLLKKAAADQHYSLSLYITGSSARSGQAVTNIRSLCEEYLKGRYDLEVIDIYQQPTQAAAEQIIAAPTLIKTLPTPPKRLVGNLSDRDKVIVGLDLRSKIQDGTKTVKWAAL